MSACLCLVHLSTCVCVCVWNILQLKSSSMTTAPRITGVPVRQILTPAPLTQTRMHTCTNFVSWRLLLSSVHLHFFYFFNTFFLSVFLSHVSSPSYPQQQPGQLRNGSWKGSNYSFARHTRLLLASTHYYLSGILQWGARPTIHWNALNFCQPRCCCCCFFFFSLSGCLHWWWQDCKGPQFEAR